MKGEEIGRGTKGREDVACGVAKRERGKERGKEEDAKTDAINTMGKEAYTVGLKVISAIQLT